MTVEKCAARCSGRKFFGTEYGGECYCGDVLGEESKGVDDGECGMLCGGDRGEFCGHAGRLSLYESSA
jgi:hypothetical protein